jgi:hypothetical protein
VKTFSQATEFVIFSLESKKNPQWKNIGQAKFLAVEGEEFEMHTNRQRECLLSLVSRLVSSMPVHRFDVLLAFMLLVVYVWVTLFGAGHCGAQEVP